MKGADARFVRHVADGIRTPLVQFRQVLDFAVYDQGVAFANVGPAGGRSEELAVGSSHTENLHAFVAKPQLHEIAPRDPRSRLDVHLADGVSGVELKQATVIMDVQVPTTGVPPRGFPVHP